MVRRRRWMAQEKGRIVAQLVAPGAVVAEVPGGRGWPSSVDRNRSRRGILSVCGLYPYRNNLTQFARSFRSDGSANFPVRCGYFQAASSPEDFCKRGGFLGSKFFDAVVLRSMIENCHLFRS